MDGLNQEQNKETKIPPWFLEIMEKYFWSSDRHKVCRVVKGKNDKFYLYGDTSKMLAKESEELQQN